MGNPTTEKSLFAGVFDSPISEVSFAKLGRKSVLQQVKEIFANQPGRPKPIIDAPSPQAIRVGAAPTPAPAAQGAVEPVQAAKQVSTSSTLPANGQDGLRVGTGRPAVIRLSNGPRARDIGAG